MLKLVAVVSLVLIGSTMWAASLSCDSCGSECTSACGTRHFRSCCFNYLRRKRGPDGLNFLSSNDHDLKPQVQKPKSERPKPPMFYVENMPEQWMTNIIESEYRPYPDEDTVENRLYAV